MNRLALTLCVLGTAASSLLAQSAQPKRPQAVTADTNSARHYYQYALSLIDSKPKEAGDALYWALKLAPGWAEALYARRVALLRSDERLLVKYIQANTKARRQFRGVDSLLSRARMIEPFLYQDLDKDMLMHYFRAAIEQDVRRNNSSVNPGELQYAIDQYARDMMRPDGDPNFTGWLAFSEHRLPEALALYAKAIGKKHDKPEIHDTRATIFYLMGQYDSAAAELRHAMAELKKDEDKELQILYQPKAMLLHRLGYTMLRKNDVEAARQAFAGALEEDLSFYPAHLMLASLALTARDTATAMQEMQLAVELNPAEATPYLRQADLLFALGQYEAATTALRRIVAMEPYWAAPHLQLALAAEKLGKPDEALQHYKNYLARAGREDQRATSVRERIRALNGNSGDSP
jgi:tetratricopeptide (TPR) repeat protein